MPIVVEAFGKRDVWGKNMECAKGHLAAAEALAYVDRSYMVYIGEHRFSIDRLSRSTPDKGK